ncbi:hypothetical protein BGW36DRAFT_399412 [Talaromyces proteolyticus]|uniref:Uncharacterized protein n=1 Tax=Talaromyces proteolyticus TaxID=1131652 RepID=A0AAD4KPC3_9EURO|nr:uncharacterized protein BGW36DRAFT_399412 [Talaromyces proteolyticus]KAH8692574.1 hypothetical protein BGW36DRAFT_399412 [Talaromyces proteolyticus]
METARENEHGYRIKEQLFGMEKPLRIIHVGAGASGICFSKFLQDRMRNVSLVCYDKNEDIGGTWLENRYPGCACDIPSVNYQFTWARKPDWSHFYSYSEEIWQYFKDVVDTFDLMKFFKLRHQVVGAYWDDGKGVWDVHVKDLSSGQIFIDSAEIFINGGGILNAWKWPNIQGISDFKGTLCHTAHYDPNTELDGKRVAVIGIGSSGIQVVANIANKVSKLYTWVRSPTWITAGFAQKYAGPNEYQDYCKAIENELNQRFKFILNGTPEAVQSKQFAVDQMKEKLQGKSELAEKLIPTTFGVGCRRPTPGNGFLEALTLPHVHTFTGEVQKITPTGFVDHFGIEHEVDVIICATGFDTSWRPRFPVVARGNNIQELYAEKPKVSHLSIAEFVIVQRKLINPSSSKLLDNGGAYGPVGHGSFLPIIELISQHILSIVKKMQTENIRSLAPRRERAEAFAEHADLFLKRTAWSSGCPSWFKQGRADGPLTIFPGSRLVFFKLLAEPRYEDYDIRYESRNPFEFLGTGFTIDEFNGSDLSYYLGTKENPGALLPPTG